MAGGDFSFFAEVHGLTITGAVVGLEHAGAGLGFRAPLAASDVVLTGNGVGLSHGFEGEVTVEDCVISANTQEGIDGTLTGVRLDVADCVISGNGSHGIFARAIEVSVTRTVIDGNGGAGILGAAIVGPALTVVDSTISDNDAGGIDLGNTSVGSALTIHNSTISGNRSDGNGGGISLNLTPGGVPDGLELNNVTITDNTADNDGDGFGNGGGIYYTDGASDTTNRVFNTIIAGNFDLGGEAPDCDGTFLSGGYNLIESTAGCTIAGDTTGNVTGVAAALGPLRDNGGPAPTHQPLVGSPAREGGNPSAPDTFVPACRITDQRGVVRPEFTTCDIGAHEVSCGNGILEDGEACDDGNFNDGDGCLSTCECDPLPDGDNDGTGDFCDNCPSTSNIDQLNSDCLDPAFALTGGCAGNVPSSLQGCCDGGDLCDPCPAQIDNTKCPSVSTGTGTIGTGGGTIHAPEVDGVITASVTIPAGALSGPTSISFTVNGPATRFSLKKDGGTAVPVSVSVKPENQRFALPVEVTLRWPDLDHDLQVDTGRCFGGADADERCDEDGQCDNNDCRGNANVPENTLVLRRNSSRFSKSGFGVRPFYPGRPPTCASTACRRTRHSADKGADHGARISNPPYEGAHRLVVYS